MNQNAKPFTTIEHMKQAHKYTHQNLEELLTPQDCVCIYCQRTFFSTEIVDYDNELPATALCPYCGIDAVIGAYSGYELNETFKEFMYEYFFNNKGTISNHILDLDLLYKYSKKL